MMIDKESIVELLMTCTLFPPEMRTKEICTPIAENLIRNKVRVEVTCDGYVVIRMERFYLGFFKSYITEDETTNIQT